MGDDLLEDTMNAKQIKSGDVVLSDKGIWYTVKSVSGNKVYMVGKSRSIKASSIVMIANAADDLE